MTLASASSSNSNHVGSTALVQVDGFDDKADTTVDRPPRTKRVRACDLSHESLCKRVGQVKAKVRSTYSAPCNSSELSQAGPEVFDPASSKVDKSSGFSGMRRSERDLKGLVCIGSVLALVYPTRGAESICMTCVRQTRRTLARQMQYDDHWIRSSRIK